MGATINVQLYAVQQLSPALIKQAEACTQVGTMLIALLVRSSTSCPPCHNAAADVLTTSRHGE